MLLAQVPHQPRAEVAAQRRGHNLHPQEIGVLARKEQPSDPQRRLHGAGVSDERFVFGDRGGKRCRDRISAVLNPFGQGRYGLPLPLADPAAAYHEAVLRRIAAAVELHHVGARQTVVLRLVVRRAVGVLRPEQGPGEGFARLDVHLRAVDGQPLLPLGAVGAQLLLGEGGAQQDVFGHGERLGEEFREGGEIDVGVVAVDVHVVPRAVVVQPFGDLGGRHLRRPLREQVRGGRGREGRALHGRSGAEYERDAQHLEILRGERVEADAVSEEGLRRCGNLDFGVRYAGLSCHLRAL